MAWAVGAGILAAPVAIHAAGDGWRIGPETTLRCASQGLLWLIPYLAVLLSGKGRVIVLLTLAFAAVLYLVTSLGWHRAKSGVGRSSRTNALKQIGTAVALYTDAFGRDPPYAGDRYFVALCRAGVLDQTVLENRERRKQEWFPKSPAPEVGFHIDYDVNALHYESVNPGTAPLVYENKPWRARDRVLRRLVLYQDQHVGSPTEPEFQKELKDSVRRP